MLNLQLLGGLSLADDSGPLTGPATQRRRLALLARLAAAPLGTLGREKLIACFWPDEDRERARHFLADSVFALRKALGKESLITVGDDLVLNAEVVACDLWRFRAALDNHDLEQGVEAYGGPFLDGFFVGDAPEFERWMEEERDRLAGHYATALEGLAERTEAEQGAARALPWWRRLAAHDPYNSRVALRLMRALAGGGERAAAIQHARVHATLLREELEVPPDPEVERYAATLLAIPAPQAESAVDQEIPRLAASGAGAPLRHPERAAEGGESKDLPPRRSDPDHQHPTNHPDHPPATTARRSRRSVRRFALLLVPVLVLGLLATMTMWGSGGLGGYETEAVEPTTTIAVLPFAYRGPPEDAYLSEGLVTLLRTSLDGAGELRTVDPYALLSRAQSLATDDAVPISPERAGEIAADLGADLFLAGTLAESGGRFHLSATLYRPGSPPTEVWTAAVEGSGAADLVDRLSRKLLLEEMDEPADRLTRLASVTTPSLSALKAYLQGEHAFRSARYPDAVQALQRAVAEDPDFALAQYRLSTAAEWSFRFTEARKAADEALRLSEALSERDERLIRAWRAFINGDAELAEQLYQAVLTDYPDDVEARSGLGEVLIHYNPVRGRARADAAASFERVLQLAPDFGEARFHLMELAAEQGRLATFDSLLSGVGPSSSQAAAWKVTREMAGRNPGARTALLDSLGRVEADLVLAVAAARTAAHFRDFEGALALAALLTDAGRPESWRAAGLIMSAQGHLARGRWSEANGALQAALPLEPAWTLEMRALALLLPHARPTEAALRTARADLEAWNPRAEDPAFSFFFATHAEVHLELRLYLLALLSLELDDRAAADGYLADLRKRGDGLAGLGTSLASSVAAHRAWLDGDAAGALRILEADAPRVPLERIALSPFFSRALDRYLRAEALAELGRTDEALAWYASLTEGPDLLFWAPAHRRQAELLRRAGQPAEARAHEDRLRRLLLETPTETTNAN